MISFFIKFYQYIFKYKYLCKIFHDSFTMDITFFVYSLNITFWLSELVCTSFWFIHRISLFDHQNIKRQSFIFRYIFTWSYSCKWQWAIAKVVFTIWLFPFLWFLRIFINSLYDSYLPLSAVFIIEYFKHLMQNRFSADTATVHV